MEWKIVLYSFLLFASQYVLKKWTWPNVGMLHPYVSTSDNSQNLPLWFPLQNMSLPAKKLGKKKLESCPVHTVRNHIPLFYVYK